MITIRSLSITIIITLFFALPFYINADTSYQVLAPIPGYVNPEVNIGPNTLGPYLNSMFKLGIALASGLAVMMIIIGGIQYASSDAWSNKSDGKERIFAALFGLLIAVGSWVLLNTISPSLVGTELVLQKVSLSSISTEQLKKGILGNAANNTNTSSQNSSNQQNNQTNTQTGNANTNAGQTNNQQQQNSTESPLPVKDGVNTNNNPSLFPTNNDTQTTADGELFNKAALTPEEKTAQQKRFDDTELLIAMSNTNAQLKIDRAPDGTLLQAQITEFGAKIPSGNANEDMVKSAQAIISSANNNGLTARIQTEDRETFNAMSAAGISSSNLYYIDENTALAGKIQPGFYLYDK